MNSTCLVRIGLDQVGAVWFDAGQAGRGGKAARPEDLRTANVNLADQAPESVSQALGEALAAVAPKPGRMLFGFDLGNLATPHVRVAIADPYVRSALMKFVKLPKARADRALLISERFSREHKLEKSAFEVAASPVSIEETQQILLCCAVPRRLIGFIRGQLAAHNLYADIIAPEVLYGLPGQAGGAGGVASVLWETLGRFKGAAGAVAPGAAGGTMLIYPDYVTLALRNETGAMVHLTSLRRGNQSPREFTERLRMRIHRYVVLLGAGEKGMTLDVLADDGLPQEIAQELANGLAQLPVSLIDVRSAPARAKKGGVMSMLKKLMGRKPGEREPFWRTMLMEAP